MEAIRRREILALGGAVALAACGGGGDTEEPGAERLNQGPKMLHRLLLKPHPGVNDTTFRATITSNKVGTASVTVTKS